MDTVIIGQGYNIQEDTSVGKELIEQFNSERYDTFTCLVAFASYGGISALTPYVMKEKERGVKIKVVLGVDQKGTSKEALEAVLAWGVDANIYHTQSINIFHPKIYLFENIDIFTLIVGSNNLTEMGLVKNIECSLMIKDIKSNPVHAKFYEYWKSILDGTEVNLYPVTQELIDKLYTDKIISSEEERTKRYDDGTDKPSSTHAKSLLFGKGDIQRNPQGFTPKRLVKVKKVKTVLKGTDGDTVQTANVSDITLSIGEEVLIAEIGGGSRWKQVNFPVEIFENFFGAQRGDNSYTIELMNVAQDGTLGKVENRQAVSVQSQNYRFEIHCAETEQAYPGTPNRPIGLFVKLGDREFIYQVLLAAHPAYERIKEYLYRESIAGRKGELRRKIVHVEAIRAIYPEFVI